MKTRMMAIFFAVVAFLFLAPSAGATWLGLANGTYDVTLSCTFSSFAFCPEDFSGTMTISGSGISSWFFIVSGDFFLGDPTDQIVDNSPASIYDSSTLVKDPLAILTLNFDLSGSTPGAPSARWWTNCANIGDGSQESCDPDTIGFWRATPVGVTVPEPDTFVIIAAGLTVFFLRKKNFGSGKA